MKPIRRLSVVHFAAAALSLAMALPAGATTFVKDVMVSGGETCLAAPTTWEYLQDALDAGGDVTLLNDIAAEDGDESLVVTNSVTLDLNGCSITGNGEDSVFVIREGGDLTLTNSMEGAGAITGGGYSGVEVEYGEFTMNGGAISGNSSYDIGGGVYVGWDGAFTMNGGAISGNGANDCGGGVFVDGTFTMNGGTISDNSADIGGGVFAEYGAFTMNGGIISDNSANGGGVCMCEDCTFTISGNPVVSGNTNFLGEASNVYLPDGEIIDVDGLSAGASIGVTTEIEPEEGYPVAIAADAAAGDAARFFSDDPGCHVEMVNGELCLVVGVGLPAYLDGAHELVIANYAAWAAKYGPDVNSAYETAFLLDIDPATPIPAGAALLKIVDFRVTAAGMHIEVASDVTEFVEKETEIPMLGNGFLTLSSALSLSSDSDWSPPFPEPFVIRGGRAVIDLENDPESGPMPPALFFKASITSFLDTMIVIGIEE